MKRQALDQLSEIGQDVGQLLDNPKTSKKINSDSEELTQRWDSLVQRLEDSSNQVPLIWVIPCAITWKLYIQVCFQFSSVQSLSCIRLSATP